MHIQRTGNAAEQHYPNIRGWLLLVAVGVILLPLRLVGILVEDLLPAFSKEGWALLTTPGAAFYHRLNAPILIFELGGTACSWSARSFSPSNSSVSEKGSPS